MYLGSAVLGGHLVLGSSVRGTHIPRTSCPGGHIRGGTCHPMTLSDSHKEAPLSTSPGTHRCIDRLLTAKEKASSHFVNLTTCAVGMDEP